MQSDVFQDFCANFIHMIEPILVALKEFDGKGPCMGKAWFVMKTLEKHMESLGDPPFSLPQESRTSVKSQFQR